MSDSSNQYGSFAATTSPKVFFDSGNLDDIIEDEELHAPHPMGDINSNGDADSYYDSDEEAMANIAQLTTTSEESFHLGVSTRMSSRNIMVHERSTSSFIEHGDAYELVPTQLKNNLRMIEDVNLLGENKGRLYLARYSAFQNAHDLKFALTVPPDIYSRVLTEVNDAYTVPCGIYFCCHGGDGAHTGVSHNDYVDIKLAWFFFGFVLLMLLAAESLG
jgi:hypothetical protein